MITITILCSLLFLWANYKIYKDTPKGENFSPVNNNLFIYLIWCFGVTVIIAAFIGFCVEFLP